MTLPGEKITAITVAISIRIASFTHSISAGPQTQVSAVHLIVAVEVADGQIGEHCQFDLRQCFERHRSRWIEGRVQNVDRGVRQITLHERTRMDRIGKHAKLAIRRGTQDRDISSQVKDLGVDRKHIEQSEGIDQMRAMLLREVRKSVVPLDARGGDVGILKVEQRQLVGKGDQHHVGEIEHQHFHPRTTQSTENRIDIIFEGVDRVVVADADS